MSFSWTVSKQFVKHRLWNRKENVCFYTKFTSSTFKIHIWKTWKKQTGGLFNENIYKTAPNQKWPYFVIPWTNSPSLKQKNSLPGLTQKVPSGINFGSNHYSSLNGQNWKPLKKRSYLHYFHVIDLQNPGVETFMKNSKKRSRLLHPHHRPKAKIAIFRYTVCKYVIFRGASMPPSLALNGRSWALNGLLGPSVGSLGSSIAPLGPDLLNKKYDC